jgi:hypothetical protein
VLYWELKFMDQELNTFDISPVITTSGDTLIYEYGCRLDKEAIPHVGDQIWHSRRLYNTLVARIREIVHEMKEFVLEQSGPEAKACQAEIDALNEAFSVAKAEKNDDELKRIAEVRRGKWRELATLVKETRKTYRSDIQTRYLSRIGKNGSCETYQIRSQAVADGLGWGTANAILDNALIAFKKSFTKGNAPRFAIGEDKEQDTLTLQFTLAGGVPAESILTGKHGELALLPTNGCGKRKYGGFRFRLGAAKAEKFASGTWQYHRAIPEDAKIGLARLIRRRVGKDVKWALQLMVKNPLKRVNPTSRKPLATVHFGWNEDINGRRVAGVADSADPGEAIVIQLPPEVEAGIKHAAVLQSDRDTSRDEIVPRLKEIELPAISEEEIDPHDPDLGKVLLLKTTEEQATIKRLPIQYVAIRRLHRLCAMLRDLDRLPDWLDAWRKEDKMRWQSATHIAKRARNLRKDFYRGLASRLSKKYSAIAIEPIDLAESAPKLNEVTGEKTEFAKKARAGRVIAAIYELESAIRHAAIKNGAALFEITGKTASQCGICGGSVVSNERDSQLLHCNHCGAELDRKQNGAAMAWQKVSDEVENLVTDFWTETLSAREEHAKKTMDKKAKMADGRKAARTKVEDKKPEDSRETDAPQSEE